MCFEIDFNAIPKPKEFMMIGTEEGWLYINIRTGEKQRFPYSYEEGLPAGGPDDAEGTPLWQPCREEK